MGSWAVVWSVVFVFWGCCGILRVSVCFLVCVFVSSEFIVMYLVVLL